MWGVTATAPDAAPADQERKAPGRPRSPCADEAIIEAVLDRAALVFVSGLAAGELRQVDRAVVLPRDDAEELVSAARQQLLGAQVQVGPVVLGELLLDDRQRGRVGPEVAAEQGQELGHLPGLLPLLRLERSVRTGFPLRHSQPPARDVIGT